MFAGLKNRIIFAGELDNANINSGASRSDLFVSDSTQNSIGCCNPSGSRSKALLMFAKHGFNSLFLFNNIFKPIMRTSVKNAAKPNHSKQAAQTKPPKTPFYSKGRYIQLKGRLNKVEREYVHLLEAYRNEKLLREYLQKESSYFMSLSCNRTEMLIANLNR